MSITPIEMYTMIPKSQEAANIKQSELTRNQNQHAQGTMKFDETISQSMQKTVGTNHSDNPEYRFDAKDGGNGAQYSGSGQRKKEKEEKGEKEIGGYVNHSERQGGIDIRI